MYFHASPIGGIEYLVPKVSEHHIPLVYFSTKRENTLVYLSNAIEKYCRETGYRYDGIWKKWGPYGFTEDGIQQLQEYYPEALEKTYRGVSGYIYSTDSIIESGYGIGIPDAAVSSMPVRVTGAEHISDAYGAILEAEEKGLISIMRYDEMSDKMRGWIQRTISQEYKDAADHPEYRHFLRGNFPDMITE